MREIAEILGIDPAKPIQIPEKPVDETHVDLNAAELNAMAELAQTSLDSIRQLQGKSGSFESEISQLSSAMAALKTQSSALHHKLLTRDKALDELEPLFEQFVPSSQVIDLILEGDMGADWYAALEQIRKPLEIPPDLLKNDDGSVPRAVEGAKKLRKILVSRALERAKTLFVMKLRMLRRPGVNAQIVQHEFLEAQATFQLINTQTPRLAAALGAAYRNTMKWYYTMLFGKYGRWLGRQPLAVADQPKLLGAAVSKSSSFFSMGTGEARSVDTFSVGARPTVLAPVSSNPDLASDQPDQDSLALPMTAVPPANSPYYPLETLVHSLLVTLADSFEIEAQMAPLISGQATPFTEVFEPTLEFYTTLCQTWISQCSGDLFGLLLAVRLAEASPLKQWIPDWLESTISAKCWPLIISICHQQAHSIEAAATKAAASISASRQGPHILTQLVSSYFSGVLQLCPGEPEPKLKRSLQEIIEAYELFVSKLASGDEKVLYNNYFVMAALLGDIPGELAQEIAKHFQMLVDAYAQAPRH